MDALMFSLAVGTAVGIVGTGLGGVLALMMRNLTDKATSVLMAFSGGIMLSVVICDLFPHALLYSSMETACLGALLGVFAMFLCERCFKHKKSNSLYLTGLLIGGAIAMHNLPEGLAIGSGLCANDSYTFAIILILLLHDIPEGMAMAIPLRAAKTGRLKTLLYTLLAGVPTGVGALLGYGIGEISATFIGGCLAFAGGAMFSITLEELLPKARALYSGKLLAAALFSGAMVGIMIVFAFE